MKVIKYNQKNKDCEHFSNDVGLYKIFTVCFNVSDSKMFIVQILIDMLCHVTESW